MSSSTIKYKLKPGTRAAVGQAGSHSLIADRPEGKAGGMGLGFNGGELLALALGGCICNDLQVLADEDELAIEDLTVTVTIEFGGQPSRSIAAVMKIDCKLADGSDPSALIERAKALTNIANSLRQGIPVTIE